MHPKLISIGDFFLPTYGVLVALGFLSGLWIAQRLGRRSGLDPETVTNLAFYSAISGIVGAKLLMLISDFERFSRNPAEIFSLSTLRAGGIFHGGLIAAILVAFWYMKRKGLPGLKTADAIVPGVALGHALGRLGCFAAGCCWGKQCDRPWAVTFTNPDAHEITGVTLNVPVHPTQLYEFAAEIVIFTILWVRFFRPHRDGAILGLYLGLYPAARFVVEFYRHHSQPNPLDGPLTAAQWFALGLVALGIWLLRRENEPRRTKR